MRLLSFNRKQQESDSTGVLTDGTEGTVRGGGQWVVLVIALILGASGIYFANKMIQRQIAEKEKALAGQHKMVQVVVPTRDLLLGERINSADMAIREIPEDYVDRNSVTPDRFETAVGQALVSDMQEGRPLLWAHLESGLVPTFSGKLPTGMRAVTVTVDQISSISGMLAPRDKIDLVLTMSQGSSSTTFPLLQNVQVLATGTRMEPSRIDNRDKADSYATVTLLLSPDDAKKIILAQDSGKIQAVLRHPEDDKPSSDEKITVSTLLSNSKPGKPYTGVQYIIGGVGGN